MIPTREQALEILKKYNKSEALIRHGLCVEGVMRYFAGRFPGEDVEKWGITGLLHDLDYELYPDEHCIMTQELLRKAGVDEEIIRACASHGWGICCDIEPQTLMEKTLYTVDELTGLIYASAIMRPNRSIMDMELKSAKKKYKSKNFAAGVDRALIEKGAEMLGMSLDEVIEWTILGMREIATAIGLDGSEAQ